MNCNRNRHVCLSDLSDYLKRTDYLGKYTPAELEEIRKNIGAKGLEDLDKLATMIMENNRCTLVTYEELIKLIDSKSLKVGNLYYITDFQSIYESNYFVNNKIPLTWGLRINPSEVCYLITTAISNDTLDTRVMLISNDENSAKWTVEYDVTCETLTDGTKTKGKITYLKDNNNNSAYYNFKHIKFRRSKSLLKKLGFTIDPVYVDIYTFTDKDLSENSGNVFNNHFDINSDNNVFLSECNNNNFGPNFRNNTFVSECINNNFGINTIDNNFKDPVKMVEGSFSNITDNNYLLSNINKKIYRCEDAYVIAFMDAETLTMQYCKI